MVFLLIMAIFHVLDYQRVPEGNPSLISHQVGEMSYTYLHYSNAPHKAAGIFPWSVSLHILHQTELLVLSSFGASYSIHKPSFTSSEAQSLAQCRAPCLRCIGQESHTQPGHMVKNWWIDRKNGGWTSPGKLGCSPGIMVDEWPDIQPYHYCSEYPNLVWRDRELVYDGIWYVFAGLRDKRQQHTIKIGRKV